MKGSSRYPANTASAAMLVRSRCVFKIVITGRIVHRKRHKAERTYRTIFITVAFIGATRCLEEEHQDERKGRHQQPQTDTKQDAGR